jgi:hypothetical protein
MNSSNEKKELKNYDHNGDYTLLSGSRELIKSLLNDIKLNLPDMTNNAESSFKD